MRISSGNTAATIANLGAELTSLATGGLEWLWPGERETWPRTAPLLFPVIGGCAQNTLRHKGRAYPASESHGFALRSEFAVISQSANRGHLQFQSNDQTRAAYPFDFTLDVHFFIRDSSLKQTATVTNTSEEVMPASLGYHPGFRWPLPSAKRSRKEQYVLLFKADEVTPIRRPANRLLGKVAEQNPVRERSLNLSEELFLPGAIVFDQLASRSLWFGAPGEPGVQLDFDMPQLGLWTIPGANFLCIEPWQGHACPEDFAGDILNKPGMIHLNPGDSFSRTMTITVNASDRSFQ